MSARVAVRPAAIPFLEAAAFTLLADQAWEVASIARTRAGDVVGLRTGADDLTTAQLARLRDAEADLEVVLAAARAARDAGVIDLAAPLARRLLPKAINAVNEAIREASAIRVPLAAYAEALQALAEVAQPSEDR